MYKYDYKIRTFDMYIICLMFFIFEGGPALWHMALHAFIADISPPEQRGFRIAMAQLAQVLPKPLSPIIGAALYERGKTLRLILVSSDYTKPSITNF